MSAISSFKYCSHCILETLKRDRSVFTRLIRDSIYYDNGVITINRWLMSQRVFQVNNPQLNTSPTYGGWRHIKCEIITMPSSNGTPFEREIDAATDVESSSLTYSSEIDEYDDDLHYDDYEYDYDNTGTSTSTSLQLNSSGDITITVDVTPTPISTLLTDNTVWATSEIADLLTASTDDE